MFFFSSRRRHTRLQGDWSSDVCSSDLVPVHREKVDAGDVDVDEAVPVDVGHGDGGLPAVGISHTGPVGDVLEPIISLIHVQPVGPDVRSEVEVGQAVVVDVTHRYSATVVVVHVGEDVERGIVGQPVGERDAGAARRQEVEQLRLAGAAAAGDGYGH